ncbi:signal peptidase, MEROPS family S26A [Abditibacterium utsteinense]|uniref:Signal peptidase I n=1 Tax=Abditibacterium utsteinense TaxID=1960156 RepID=A0A2S8SPX5_9BACT|nr:signal peptidase I [Abditibacterium utsteinense]PQV62853.1 signal peptidase, MEROPS family S26A [Abditibacterium utsteinense]
MAIVVSTQAPKEPHNSAAQIEKRRLTRALMQGGAIILLLLFGLLLRLLAWEGVLVTSGSMEPLLRKGDYTLVDHRVVLRGAWQRGDVIIFRSPVTWQGADETLVKRVIGLPGETVALVAGQVFINGVPLREDYFGEQPDPQDIPPVQLGFDEYFVMGDNRNNSSDSRENGPVPASDIRGKILMRLWPFPRFSRLSSPDYGTN